MEPIPDPVFRTIIITFIDFEGEKITIISHDARSVELQYQTVMPFIPENVPEFNVHFYMDVQPGILIEGVIKARLIAGQLILKWDLEHLGLGSVVVLALNLAIR